MFRQIKISKDVKKCPQCGKPIEWCAGKTDNTRMEYMCLSCRIHIIIEGFTKEDQEEIAETAFC